MGDASTPLAFSPTGSDEYVAGVCNIGPAEIGRRRQAAHVGLVATIAASGLAVAVDAPPLVRLLVGLPAAAAASGYLQARLRFCAGFGARGIFDFGALGKRDRVVDPLAAARDRAKARRISMASLAVGAAVGIVAAALPS